MGGMDLKKVLQGAFQSRANNNAHPGVLLVPSSAKVSITFYLLGLFGNLFDFTVATYGTYRPLFLVVTTLA